MALTRERFEGMGWPLLIAAIAFLVFLVALAVSTDVRDNIWTTLGEVGAEIAFIVFLGGVLTQSLQARLRKNEESRQLNEYRLHLLLDLVGAYHQAKAVRRALRPVGVGTDQEALAEWQVDEIRAQLTELNTAQLAFERLRRELEVNLGLLVRRDDVAEHITAIDTYLREVTREWEAQGIAVAVGKPMRATDWPKLRAFAIRGSEGSTFHRGVIDHELYVEKIIRTNIALGHRERGKEPEYPTYHPSPAGPAVPIEVSRA